MTDIKHCNNGETCLLAKQSQDECDCDCLVCMPINLEDIEYDEYFDDEPARKPKTGKSLKKFKHPNDR